MSTNWHILTGEYPPVEGGVGDYAFTLSNELAHAGDEVHVWCPASAGHGLEQPGVHIHPEFHQFGLKDCRRIGRLLNRATKPRRLLIQWVPHAFGFRGVNVPFCLWVLYRSIVSGDVVELMVHEPFLRVGGSVKQRTAAIAQRLMIISLLLAASRVWVSQPYWWTLLRPFGLGRKMNVGWLPLPSNVPLQTDPDRVAEIRSENTGSTWWIGHFGLFGPGKDSYFSPYVEALLDRKPDIAVRLVGLGCGRTRDSILKRRPAFETRLVAIEGVRKDQAVCHLAACDVLVQPYVDGVSSRRTSIMAGLALGIATVTHEGESTESLWKDSEAVLLAGPSPSDYAEAIAALLEDPELRSRLGEKAVDLYERRFHIRYVVARLREPFSTAAPVVDEAIAAAGLEPAK